MRRETHISQSKAAVYTFVDDTISVNNVDVQHNSVTINSAKGMFQVGEK